MCLGYGHSSQAQPQAPGPTAGANGPTCQRPHWVGPARDLGGEAPLSLPAALFGAGSSMATDGSIAGRPLTPPPRRWLAPAAPPRRRSAAEAAKCNRSAGRTDVGTLVVVTAGDQRAGLSRDRERRVAGHPNYQAMAEETDAAW